MGHPCNSCRRNDESTHPGVEERNKTGAPQAGSAWNLPNSVWAWTDQRGRLTTIPPQSEPIATAGPRLAFVPLDAPVTFPHECLAVVYLSSKPGTGGGSGIVWR